MVTQLPRIYSQTVFSEQESNTVNTMQYCVQCVKHFKDKL